MKATRHLAENTHNTYREDTITRVLVECLRKELTKVHYLKVWSLKVDLGHSGGTRFIKGGLSPSR